MEREADEVVDAVRELVHLDRIAQKRALLAVENKRLTALETILRQEIDGAHAAPREAPVVRPPASRTKITRKSPAAPEARAPSRFKLDLSKETQKKIRAVSLKTLASDYTPPRTPAFMSDYYHQDLVPQTGPTDQRPKTIVRADGEAADLSEEASVLLGLIDDLETKETGRTKRRPTIVHLVHGGTQRGQIEPFSAEDPSLTLVTDPTKGTKATVNLRDILAIFYGRQEGEPETPLEGTPVVVTLVNDRTVRGLTPDYEKGNKTMTLIPDPRPGPIDRIWIPAWAVRKITFP